ncbi:UMP-CMP kinase [Schistosoma japonicum]|nr:UMP-CMP kinase [Schistosoma japonicum]
MNKCKFIERIVFQYQSPQHFDSIKKIWWSLSVVKSIFVKSLNTTSWRRNMRFNICFVLGGPGAGKGTVCQQIVKEYGFVHLSAGELLREARDSSDSEFASKIQMHMKNGTIVPAKITCGLLYQAMKKNYENAKCTNFLVDGFPRNDDNRLCWEEDLSTSTVLKRVIVLECPDDVCVQRCLGRHSNRIDDNEETLKLRIKQFKEQCMPVIQFYEKQNLVTRIDANKSIPEVYEQVRQMMQTLNFNCK